MPKITKLLLILSVLIVYCNTINAQPRQENKNDILAKEAPLKAGMRFLWEEHVVWTRNVIFCLIDSLPGTNLAMKRLLQNQTDIGNAFRPIYGDAIANKFTQLLYAHINLAADVIKAAKANNNDVLAEANKKWYANGDEIALYLNTINPNWEVLEMKLMISYHLKLTMDETMNRIKKDYETDITVFDKMHIEIIKMADMLTKGIYIQYPLKLK